MAYTPTTWTTGDTITASALNKIENGIADAGGGASGLCTDTEGVLDKSYNDIASMLSNGVLPWSYYDTTISPITFLENEGGTYSATFGNLGTYTASSASAPLEFTE